MAENEGCARVTGAVEGEDKISPSQPETEGISNQKEIKMSARVGQKAPDFTAPAYYKGGFEPVKLSDFAGNIDYWSCHRHT